MHCNTADVAVAHQARWQLPDYVLAHSCLQETLNKVLLFNKLEQHLQRKIVSEMYERNVTAGEILIKEGDTGLAASELYVVKSGKFEVSS